VGRRRRRRARGHACSPLPQDARLHASQPVPDAAVFEAHRSQKKVAPLVRQLSWTHHLIITIQTRRPEERGFSHARGHQGRVDEARARRPDPVSGDSAERRATKMVSPAVTRIHPTAVDELKSAYFLELLSIESAHSEADLHGALLRDLGRSSPSSVANSASWAPSIRSRPATRTSRSHPGRRTTPTTATASEGTHAVPARSARYHPRHVRLHGPRRTRHADEDLRATRRRRASSRRDGWSRQRAMRVGARRDA
jgi:hypothetical protein